MATLSQRLGELVLGLDRPRSHEVEDGLLAAFLHSS
jgi:hypothetical protein